MINATRIGRAGSQLYADQLAFANSQVKADRIALLAGPPETDPIIVIMGDEGPFLCRNVDCVDPTVRRLGIRFGVLAAYYLPDQPAGFFPVDHTSVNTFRSIFERLLRRRPAAAPRPLLRLAGQRSHLRLPRHHRPTAAARQPGSPGRHRHASDGHGRRRCIRSARRARGSQRVGMTRGCGRRDPCHRGRRVRTSASLRCISGDAFRRRTTGRRSPGPPERGHSRWMAAGERQIDGRRHWSGLVGVTSLGVLRHKVAGLTHRPAPTRRTRGMRPRAPHRTPRRSARPGHWPIRTERSPCGREGIG